LSSLAKAHAPGVQRAGALPTWTCRAQLSIEAAARYLDAFATDD